LPVQPNANLIGITRDDNGAMKALMSFSNHGRHVSKASHFAVYDNAAAVKTFLTYPQNAPSQHTVDPASSRKEAARPLLALAAPLVPGAYDLTVIGPNRFLRHFTGNLLTGDSASHVEVDYHPHGDGHAPKFAVRLANYGKQPVTFSI